MEENLVPVIMAGGAGTRFWPLSTEKRPKQFLSLFGSRTLIQMSFDRISTMVDAGRVFVLTNAGFTHYVREQLPDLPGKNIIGEPVRRDTAAAITLAALLARKKFGNPVLAVLTADHIIEPAEKFQSAILSAAREARKNEAIYTFGITPSYPASAYGYLELGEEIQKDRDTAHFKLLSFKEKPDEATAKKYIEKGNYCWNSGMFIAQTDVLLGQIEKFLPKHMNRLSAVAESFGSENWEKDLLSGLDLLPSISIDFGVMEKAENLRCAVASFSWKDVGGWLALEDYLSEDSDANFYQGKLHTLDAGSNLVFCEDTQETIALIGVKDLVIVRSGNRTLIVDRQRAEDIKKLVKSLKGSD